ncbi:MAG: DUF192 domain-containing protein [Bacteriovorax sp.]|nr:DUF192 domain-containing protein [Bacteriovorax sp.]
MQNKIYILKDQAANIICKKMIVVNQSFDRMKGLMFSSEMPDCDGFLITGALPCNSIHTFFMLYSLDILFLDKNFTVVKAIYDLSPWRITWMYFKAHQVLEMQAGTMKKDIKVGDKLEAICIN